MSRVRVYELAKEAGMSSKALTDKLIEQGYDIKGHSSSVDDETAEKIRKTVLTSANTELVEKRIDSDSERSTVIRRRATVIRRPAKVKEEVEDVAEETTDTEIAASDVQGSGDAVTEPVAVSDEKTVSDDVVEEPAVQVEEVVAETAEETVTDSTVEDTAKPAVKPEGAGAVVVEAKKVEDKKGEVKTPAEPAKVVKPNGQPQKKRQIQ